jgi:hypothetical protein
MCGGKNRAGPQFGGAGGPPFAARRGGCCGSHRRGHPGPIGMLVRHMIEKRQAKKDAEAGLEQPSYYDTLPTRQVTGTTQRRPEPEWEEWVDEKQEARRIEAERERERQTMRMSRETVRTELPTYGQVMKGVA